MEEMERTIRQEGQDGPVWDEQLLERVWARVLQGRPDRESWEGPGDSVDGGELSVQRQREVPTPAREDETMESRKTACFGRASQAHAHLLRRMIDGEGEDGRIYRALSLRAAGSLARQLLLLARQEEAHARRLSAAYYILTGRRYRWAGQGEARPPVELMSGLREQLLQAQRESEAYRQAANQTGDPCLAELFRELADQEGEQVRTLRRILERM